MLYADVCVNTPLGQRAHAVASGSDEYDLKDETFTYAVPDRLAPRIQPGHLVWVPFRGRRLQAVVLGLSDTSPDFGTLDIHAFVWAQPLLTPEQLDLARWVARYYLAPLIESLRLMLPAGLSQRGRTVLARTTLAAPPNLNPTQAALLARIAEAEGEWSEVSAGLKVTQKTDLNPLIALGLVTQEVAFPTPPPRPKTDRQVRLLADAAGVVRALPTLGRASKQADVLAWVAEQAAVGVPLTLKDVTTAIGCGPGPVEMLAARGWLALDAPPPAEGARATKGAGLVRMLLAQDDVSDALITLRGAEKHRAVLETLQRLGGASWIGRVYAETGATLQTLRDLEAAGLVTIAEEMIWRDPLAGQDFTLDRPPDLTLLSGAAPGKPSGRRLKERTTRRRTCPERSCCMV